MRLELYPILKDLIGIETNETDIVRIPFSTIWTKITTEHAIKGNLYSDNQYVTRDYGDIYQNTLSRFIGDKFSAKLKHGEEGSELVFVKSEFSSYDEVYNHQAEGSDVKIVVELVEDLPEPDSTDGTDGPSDRFESVNGKEEDDNPSPKPSEPSEPSAFPRKCYRCNFSNYGTKGEYDKHCVIRHPGLSAYPGPADIKESNLTPQGMSWEKPQSIPDAKIITD